MSNATKRVLPADVYDTLEFSALAFGGIGSILLYEMDETPCCILGHAAVATDGDAICNPIRDALRDVGIGAILNDEVVPRRSRITFATWCRRLNVVRGTA